MPEETNSISAEEYGQINKTLPGFDGYFIVVGDIYSLNNILRKRRLAHASRDLKSDIYNAWIFVCLFICFFVYGTVINNNEYIYISSAANI